MIRFTDTMGSINIHGDWKVYDLQESHSFMSGPIDQDGIRVYIFLEILDIHSITGEASGSKYAVEVSMVAPREVDEKEKASAKESLGWPWDPFNPGEPSEEQMAQILFGYGTKGSVFSQAGNSLRTITRNAIRAAQVASDSISSYFDVRQNQIGSTAWEVMTGDILAPLFDDRSNTESGRLMRKMYGIA